MRDLWLDLASSISAAAFHMPSLPFKPTLLNADRSTTPAVTHARTHDSRRGAGSRGKPTL